MADLNPMWKVYNEPNSIKLPESVEVFANLKNGKQFAIDIGCSLTKITYYSSTKHKQCCYNHKKKNPYKSKSNIVEKESENVSLVNINNNNNNNINNNSNKEINIESSYKAAEEENDNESTSQKCSQKNCEVEQMSQLHFAKFQTKYLENCLDFIENHIIGNKELVKGKTIKATGCGVFKYSTWIKEKLGVIIDVEDETNCLIKGTNFLLRNVSKEAFIFQRNGDPEYIFQTTDSDLYPYILVSIGSGVSIIKVTAEEDFERIGGLSTGGATFWGLGSLLTSAKEYDELLELAENGDYRKVDMLVRDIFGDSNGTGLSSDFVTASFGKINYSNGETSQKKFSEADIARSLLFTILNSIGQVASLYAMMHTVSKVYFGGYFLRNNPLKMEVLSRCVNYWSDNKIKALFLRHEGYLGTLGAFLKGSEEWVKEGTNNCKYSGISGTNPTNEKNESSSEKDGLANLESEFSMCPLLKDPDNYCPDTVNLLEDEEAREYWLECFEDTAKKFAKKAVESQPDDTTSEKRAECFKEKIISRLRYLKTNPSMNGILTVRTLLETIDQFLREYNFPDPYLKQKQLENKTALAHFSQHISELDKLEKESREEKLILYLLAGNMFDWGAKEVSALLGTNKFGFSDALDKIPQRPWLVDCLDQWVQRLKGPPHKCAVVFVDNSGFDIILGVFPFVRELLRRGTEVILCSNSGPALNDVTHSELLQIINEIKKLCPIIKEAEEKGALVAMETGQTGPCLDLSHLKKNLCDEITIRGVDLIVIEGMGRSVHTNLYTQFSCESLKVAVIKNRWLASRLGGDMFCAICQYHNNLTS